MTEVSCDIESLSSCATGLDGVRDQVREAGDAGATAQGYTTEAFGILCQILSIPANLCQGVVRGGIGALGLSLDGLVVGVRDSQAAFEESEGQACTRLEQLGQRIAP